MLEALRFFLFGCSGLFILLLCLFGFLFAGQGIWKQLLRMDDEEDSQLSQLEALNVELALLSRRISHLESVHHPGTWTRSFALWSLRRKMRDLEQRRVRILHLVNRVSPVSTAIRLPVSKDRETPQTGIRTSGEAFSTEPDLER